jgi:hypothetical protein
VHTSGFTIQVENVKKTQTQSTTQDYKMFVLNFLNLLFMSKIIAGNRSIAPALMLETPIIELYLLVLYTLLYASSLQGMSYVFLLTCHVDEVSLFKTQAQI